MLQGRTSSVHDESRSCSDSAKKQLIFREGGGWFDFLILKRTVVSKKTFRDLRVPCIS